MNFEKNQEQENILKEYEERINRLEIVADKFMKENMNLDEKLKNYENNNYNYKLDIETKLAEIDQLTNENFEFKKIVDEERHKNRNLVNLIKELEKKKISNNINNETNILREQVELLTNKLNELENKYRSKLDKKDKIIRKLDDSLVEYERKINKANNINF